MIRYRSEIAELLEKHFASSDFSKKQILDLLEKPQRAEHGDIAFPCFILAKQLKKAPPLLAKELATELSTKLGTNFSGVEAAGPYLNFRLSAEAALNILTRVLEQKENFGKNSIGNGQKVLIEYSSPNVAKQLHIGHFRNTILGQSINNLYSACGYEVISVNHLGDWGSQFGKVAYAYLKYGNAAEMEESPLEYLTKLYVRVTQEAEENPEVDREARLLFKKIEEKDPELTALWKKFCDLSIKDLEKIYSRLGVKFQHYIGESFYIDKIPALLEELKAKNLLTVSEGAQVVDLGKSMPPCLILTGDGTSLYATRDLAAAIYRHKRFQFDQSLYVVGNEQQLHFKQVFKVLELMGHGWCTNLKHLNYGLYRFKDGKLSTRKGQVVLATEVINEARDKSLTVIEQKNPGLKNKAEVAEKVGLGAVIFHDLATDRIKDVEFDWEKVLDFEGDTGAYLLYSYARASSILRQGTTKQLSPKLHLDSKTLRESPQAIALMKKFGDLEPSILGAVRLNKPSIVANYAIDLAQSFSAFYRNVKVIDDTTNKLEIEARLSLVQAFRLVLANTLQLLCVQTVEEM